MYKHFFKRIIDIVVSLLVLILTTPILLFTTIALFIANNGKVIFTQQRPGLNNKIFKIVKFKTMNDKRDSRGELLDDHIRLTKVGRWVRKLSIDELPQLINVLKGEMSLIGPRPLLVEYLEYYDSEQIQRHNVRPGITGWAQVNGRNAISWEDKFKFDVWYVNNMSALVDLKIIFLTIYKVFKREGINANQEITMEKFTGTK